MRMVLLAILLVCGGCDSGKTSRTPQAAQPRLAAFDGSEGNDSPARLAHGKRLAAVLGCRGCHGTELTGQLWDDDPKGYGVLWASNLTQAIPSMSDAQLMKLLTIGTHPRRAELWVMPSELFQHLDAGDLEALVIYLRSLTPVGEKSPDPVLGPLAIAEVKAGNIKPAAKMVKELNGVGPDDLGPEHSLGRYITMVACAECHGPKLKGKEGDTPDLVVASGYTRAEFERLITEGVPTGDRKLKPLMQSVARSRYSQLTMKERDALYNYLKALAALPSS